MGRVKNIGEIYTKWGQGVIDRSFSTLKTEFEEGRRERMSGI